MRRSDVDGDAWDAAGDARMTSIALNGSEYVQAGELAAASGGIHDALIWQCFLKSQAEVLYTWNLKHFLRLGGRISGRVRPPNG